MRETSTKALYQQISMNQLKVKQLIKISFFDIDGTLGETLALAVDLFRVKCSHESNTRKQTACVRLSNFCEEPHRLYFVTTLKFSSD